MRTFRQFLLITWGHWRRWDHSDDLKCSVSYRGYQCANSVHRMVVPKLNFCCYTQIGVATQFIEPSTLICPQAASTQYAFCWRENHVKMFHANCIISTWDSETRLTSPAETSYELTLFVCSEPTVSYHISVAKMSCRKIQYELECSAVPIHKFF